MYLPEAAFGEDDIATTIAKIAAEGPFTKSTVIEIARALSKADYVPPPTDLPDPIKSLTYEQYRDIRSDRDKSIWSDENLPFRLQLFHRGFYYKEEIDVAIVSDGTAHHLAYSPNLFVFGKLVPQPIPPTTSGSRESASSATSTSRTSWTRSRSSWGPAISARSAAIRSMDCRRAAWR